MPPVSSFNNGRPRSAGASSSSRNTNLDESQGIGSLLSEAAEAQHAGKTKKLMSHWDSESLFDADDPRIKEDILRMVVQYLQNEGFTASTMCIKDEANVKMSEQLSKRTQYTRVRKTILEGEWGEVEKLVLKNPVRSQKSFMYAMYKQQYLELIEQMEYQKAFSLLTKRLKPLESMETMHNEFRDLCYLLTCKRAHDVPSLKNWEGVAAAREQLVEQYLSMLEFETNALGGMGPTQEMPPDRLLNMLGQAVAYQIEFSRYRPKVCPKVTSLMEDYRCFVLPNALRRTFAGHQANVKCLAFVGEEGEHIVSGSSDNSLRVWGVESGACVHVLGGEGGGPDGHTSRVWDVSSSKSGDLVVSASGDATVKLWSLRGGSAGACVSTMAGHDGDAYAARFSPSGSHIVTGGYDKTVRLWDARTGAEVKTFWGHDAPVTCALFNPYGNLIVSGSKDSTIKFWDILSGVCVKTLSMHLGEVTSVEMNSSGSWLLSGSKDNSNRLWDVRAGRPIQRFKGHQNTSKNFVRASFGPNEKLVVGGSEDGVVYVWDAGTGEVLQKLGARGAVSRGTRHGGIVYRAVWNARQSLLASCSHDTTVKTWWFDPAQPLGDPAGGQGAGWPV